MNTDNCILCGKPTGENYYCADCQTVEDYLDNANRTTIHYFFTKLREIEFGYTFHISEINDKDVFNLMDKKPKEMDFREVAANYILALSGLTVENIPPEHKQWFNGLTQKLVHRYFVHLNSHLSDSSSDNIN